MGGAILHQIVRLEMRSCPNPYRVQSGNCVWPQVCVFAFHFFSAISRDIHTVAVYVAVLMEPTSAELCELSKPGALLKWVGVPEATAPAHVVTKGCSCRHGFALLIAVCIVWDLTLKSLLHIPSCSMIYDPQTPPAVHAPTEYLMNFLTEHTT